MWTLSNGRYTVFLGESGAGYSTWNDYALTPWSHDPTEQHEGFWFYLHDLESSQVWSLTRQPRAVRGGIYEAEEVGGRVRLRSLVAEIEATLDITVAADADCELRTVTLVNHSTRPRRLALTSCIEVVLNQAAAHAAHPAFSKLFVQTEQHDGVLLARRRPRNATEEHPWLTHALLDATSDELETDRVRFIGRGRSSHNPAAVDHALSGTVGNVLDPLLSLRHFVVLEPGQALSARALLAVAASRQAALALVTNLKASAAEPGSVACSEPPLPEAHAFASGFSSDGDEYIMHVGVNADGTRRLPPMPWINVISNEHFGFLVSETGAGSTWSRNSRQNRLTPWYNDPVCDPHGEALYIRDDDSGVFWSPQAGPASGAPCEVRHGFGYSRWQQTTHEIEQVVTELVARNDPLKISHLHLTNHGSVLRRLSLFSYRRLVLGVTPAESAPSIVTELDGAHRILFARNPLNHEFGDAVVFAAAVSSSGSVHFTADRTSFIGSGGCVDAPQALTRGGMLADTVGANLDPCAVVQLCVELPPGARCDVAFLLGETTTPEEARRLVEGLRAPGALARALDEVKEHWQGVLTAVQVRTPSPALDLMLNGWLLYQTLSCRMWGRSAFYQSGGAFGYRDQLQDCSALIYARPELTRAQILLHAAHQFVEGDVMHWWHPPIDRGLRTRFSDDLLWLPFLTSFYVQSTGDFGLLDETASFMAARLLEPGEDEAYLQVTRSEEVAGVYEHCCRAIDRSLTKGAHGLPLMGTGDWNDGMNRVGREGRGESVWLGFFLYRLLEHFIPLCRQRGDATRAQRYEEYRGELQAALEQAWDGEWYRRAYYDDGTPLGSAQNEECRIDALAQAWSVISQAVARDRASQAIDSVEQHLISREDGIIRLLTPPFDSAPHDPGYIKGYVRGIRENGGQYTHAALWVVQAFAELGRRNDAAALLEMIGPVFHTSTAQRLATYQVEPYVVAADIYGEAPHVGRGGWTWYTGSSAWMYRVGLESILGLTLHLGEELRLQPCIPDAWPAFSIRFTVAGEATVYDINVSNPGQCSARVLRCTIDGDGAAIEDGSARVPLLHDGKTHSVEIEMGA